MSAVCFIDNLPPELLSRIFEVGSAVNESEDKDDMPDDDLIANGADEEDTYDSDSVILHSCLLASSSPLRKNLKMKMEMEMRKGPMMRKILVPPDPLIPFPRGFRSKSSFPISAVTGAMWPSLLHLSGRPMKPLWKHVHRTSPYRRGWTQ